MHPTNRLIRHLSDIAFLILVSMYALVVMGCMQYKSASPNALSKESVAIHIDSLQFGSDRVDAKDINRDGYPDLVAGNKLYINPQGVLEAKWQYIDLDVGFQSLFFFDVDEDGHPDLIGIIDEQLYWLEALNPEGIHWSSSPVVQLSVMSKNVPVSIQEGQILADDKRVVVFEAANQYYFLDIPQYPASAPWYIRRIHADQLQLDTFSLSVIDVDLDKDGDLDQAVLQGNPERLVVIHKK